jgi:hypothetical protein
MRKFLSTLALMGLLAIPVLAQFPGFGRGLTGDQLLTIKGVQDELKLSDEQKKELAEAQKTTQEAFRKSFELRMEGENEKAAEVVKKASDEAAKTYKKIREGFSEKQAERFAQIELQMVMTGKQKNPDVFKMKIVADAAKFTEKQQELIKETIENLGKDIKEVEDDYKEKKGKEKFGSFRKINELRGEAYDKIAKELTDEQKEAIEKAKGEKFELKFDFPKDGFFKDKGKKDKKKKDDA